MQEIRKKWEKNQRGRKKRGYRNILLKIDRMKDGKRAAFAKITSNRSKIDEIQAQKKAKKKKHGVKGRKKKVCTRVLAHRDNKNEFLLSYSQNTAPLDNVQEFRNPKRNIQFDKKCEQMKNYGRSI